MAKFIFKMESILSVKEKLEEQAKAEYSIEMMKLRQEEEKLDKLKLRRDMYQSKLYDAVTDKLNILEIKILEDSVENIKYNIKLQMVVVANQQRVVEKAGEKLDNAMKERKTYEKLKENAFEEFKAEINAEEQKAIELCQKIQLKAKDISAPPSSLSGGNQQKVVFAKLLNCDLKVLILDEPTKGIDVGAKYSIYEIMNELTANGYAIIMVSSEMPEVLGMADRIVVMRSGRVVGQFDTQGTTQEMILEASLKHESDRREG